MAARRGRNWRTGWRSATRRPMPQVRSVRGSICAERGRGVHPDGNRGEGAPAGDPPPSLAAWMRMRGACGSAGASGAEAVSLHPLRNGVLDLFPVR